MLRNLAEFPRALRWNAAVTGLLIVLVTSTGPIALILEAARRGGLDAATTTSWVGMTWLLSGVFGLLLSLRHRAPVIGAWSTPGVALLAGSLPTHGINAAVGAYILVAVAVFLVGAAGWFDRLLAHVPRPVVMAMLAGVLFEFGVQTFVVLPQDPWLVVAMVGAYFVARRLQWRAPVVAAAVAGVMVALLHGAFGRIDASLSLLHLQFVRPEFSLASTVTLALPLFLVTMTSQYAPGAAVLTAAGYRVPVREALMAGGVLSLLSAPFANAGVNSAAISAAMGTSPDAEPDPERRYTVGVVAGLVYILVAVFTGTMLAFFGAMPATLLAGLAGLGLLSAIGSSVAEAFAQADYRESALMTFLVTVSGVTLLGMGAPFWGLVAGVGVHRLVEARTTTTNPTERH